MLVVSQDEVTTFLLHAFEIVQFNIELDGAQKLYCGTFFWHFLVS